MSGPKERKHNKEMNEMNINFQREANEENARRAMEQYRIQRQHALDDRNYADRYNSPQQVMQRYKEAGLNPHLIYDNGTHSPSATVKSSDFAKPDAQAPEVKQHIPYVTSQQKLEGISDSLAGLSDTMSKTAQINNYEANTAYLKAKELNEYQTLETKTFDLGQKQKLQDITSEMAEQKLRNAKLDGNIKENIPDLKEREMSNREAQTALARQKVLMEGRKLNLAEAKSPYEMAKMAASVAKDNQYIVNSEAQIKKLEQESTLRALEIRIKEEELLMRQLGLNPNSSQWYDRLINIMTKSMYKLVY